MADVEIEVGDRVSYVIRETPERPGFAFTHSWTKRTQHVYTVTSLYEDRDGARTANCVEVMPPRNLHNPYTPDEFIGDVANLRLVAKATYVDA